MNDLLFGLFFIIGFFGSIPGILCLKYLYKAFRNKEDIELKRKKVKK